MVPAVFAHFWCQLMKLRLRLLSASLLILLLCRSSNAVLVVDLVVDPGGTFDVFISDNGTGDTSGTFGIQSYGIPFTEPSSILSIDQIAPNGIRNDTFAAVGFRAFPVSTGDTVPSPLTVINGQPSFATTPTHTRVGGFGQVVGDLSTVVGVGIIAAEQASYDSKLHVVQGTWNTALAAPMIDTGSVDFKGAVFADAALQTTMAVSLTAVPEPSAIFMLTMPVLILISRHGIAACFARCSKLEA